MNLDKGNTVTWFKDFGNCEYFGKGLEKKLLPVGWLSKNEEFSEGVVDESDLRLVIEYCKKPFWIHVFRGFHECELCELSSPMEETYNSSGCKLFGKQKIAKQYLKEESVFKPTSHLNIFVPYGDKIIVAPENLPHYIKDHGYKPPIEFFNALRESPKPGTKELSDLLIEIGGGSFAEIKGDRSN
jgi:hypothetical protein